MPFILRSSPSVHWREVIHTAADTGKPLSDKLGTASVVVVGLGGEGMDELKALKMAQKLLCSGGWLVLVRFFDFIGLAGADLVEFRMHSILQITWT